MMCIKALTNYIHWAINDTTAGLTLLNKKVKINKTGYPPNLDDTGHSKSAEDTYEIVKAKCVYIPDHSANISITIQDIR